MLRIIFNLTVTKTLFSKRSHSHLWDNICAASLYIVKFTNQKEWEIQNTLTLQS